MNNQIPLEKLFSASPNIKACARELNRYLEQNNIVLFPDVQEAKKDMEYWRDRAIELQQEKEDKLPNPDLVSGCGY